MDLLYKHLSVSYLMNEITLTIIRISKVVKQKLPPTINHIGIKYSTVHLFKF
jgi:hypothetical protein